MGVPGKKKGKKKDESLVPDTGGEDEANETEFHLALLEIRVKELENLNMGLKKKCDYLESQNNVYKEQLTEAIDEKNDLVTHLQRNLYEEKTNVKELEDRLFGVQQARTDEAKEYEKRLAKKDEEFNDMKFKLDKHILELTAKLTSVEDFRVQKDKLMSETEELRTNLIDGRKEFEKKFEDLENRMIRSRERMKNDSVEIVTQMAKDISKAGRLCLTATVKNAIDENIRLKKEIETTSLENLKLREDLQSMSDSLRTKRMTVQVLEEENSMVHKKCLQFRKMVSELAQRQIVMDVRIKLVDELEKELLDVKRAHARCKYTGDTDRFKQIVLKVTGALKKRDGPSALHGILDADSLQRQVKSLQDIIIKMALAAKDITEAMNADELEYFKGRFWTMLLKLYELACELPDLPQEIKKKLIINVPKITSCIKR